MNKPRGLGKGLSALIGENFVDINDRDFISIAIENIEANPNQPRVIFNQNELEELSSSIKQNGLLQPIIVRKIKNNNYQIIAGERRWRAAKLAGLKNLPAIVKELEDEKLLEVALIENIQRENLTPLEEAESYKRLIDECNYTQEKMAEIVSKSRSHIANLLRLLSLPDSIKEYLKEGKISLGHAKLLINQKNNEELAERIAKNNLSVRETEELLKEKKVNLDVNKTRKEKHQDEDTKSLEQALATMLDMPVKIDHTGKGGTLTVKFRNIIELDILIQKLSDSIG